MENNTKKDSRISKHKWAIYTIAVMMVIICIAGFISIILFGNQLTEAVFFKLMICFLALVFAFILFICCSFSSYEITQQGQKLVLISLLLYVNLLLSGLFDLLEGRSEMHGMILALITITCMLSILIHFLIWQYLCISLPTNRGRRYYFGLVCFLGVTYITMLIVNLFTGFLFYVDGSGRMHYPGVLFEIIICLIYYFVFLIYVLTNSCPLHRKLAFASFAIFSFFPYILGLLQYIVGMPYDALSNVYFFPLLAVYVIFFFDYRESRETLLRQKKELAEQKRIQTELQTKLAFSQIRPHFLYNALTAIRSLCGDAQSEVYTALGEFSDYLRGNLDIMSGGRMIPFSKELEHIRTYLALEQLRFEDDLQVEYDIQYEAFSLPALTVQPIVENAVRYGATANEAGGVVTIRTEKTDEGACIIIKDNGPGFDPHRLPADDRNHYGIEMIRQSLRNGGYGELHIDSTIGTGTTVTIRIWEGSK